MTNWEEEKEVMGRWKEYFKELLNITEEQTINETTANKPDITLLNLKNKLMFVIESSCPAGPNISRKEKEKRDKYQDLLSELRKLYPGFTVQLVVLIISVLGGMKASCKREIEIIPACRASVNSLLYSNRCVS
ncbi:hypothetical protein CBL_01781 [Carabus blaptoides fortunei]